MLEDKTPREVWTDKKHSLSHLRVFICDAYVHAPKEKIIKLNSKSKRCILIGYKDGLKGYNIWNPEKKKVVYSQDVVFREVKYVIKHEVLPEEPEKIEFQLKEEESDATTEKELENEEPQTPAMRRPVRERREAVDSKDGNLWKEAMVDEMTYFDKNEAWYLMELPAGRKPTGRKWVFKKNMNVEGKVEKYKARLVAKGYSEVSRNDFGDIVSPFDKVASIRLLLILCCYY
eukprot:PITA_18063